MASLFHQSSGQLNNHEYDYDYQFQQNFIELETSLESDPNSYN